MAKAGAAGGSRCKNLQHRQGGVGERPTVSRGRTHSGRRCLIYDELNL